MMLGNGSLLVWIGVLRYLGFFRTYNVLLLTVQGALPSMLRFLICASLLYVGFTVAGWAVLGPYHSKFSTLSSSSECLFSLINGDDVFATFALLSMETEPSVWLYSRIYLYTFSCLFIYVVLSLFISIIMDTYEAIKHCYTSGFPAGRLDQFYLSSSHDFSPGQYRREWTHARLWGLIRGHTHTERDSSAAQTVNS